MQFHHQGYISGDPRVQPAAGTGIGRPETLPECTDVLIVGAGPAGHIAAAQLSQFPSVSTRIIERRGERLAVGHADGIQARSVETFQAFGFAGRFMEEAHRVTACAFWSPDPAHPENIIRTHVPPDDPSGASEFPHLMCNQARVQDYFADYMARSPTRMQIDYGWEFLGLEVADHGDYPVTVHVHGSALAQEGTERTIRAKYVIGCDGAHSRVRDAIGRVMSGDEAMHAWGVIDVIAVTDFPDIRMKSIIQSHDGGNILLIPREGGFLFRMYVDVGDLDSASHHEVRNMSLEDIVGHANRIIHPYKLEVKEAAWYSVYEVAHRLTDHFDDVDPDQVGQRLPRVFLTGDACHTHSAKAGQGMNVSIQDGFNLAWKLGHVLDGRSPASLLATYSAERQVVAKELIDFDKEWSTLMAKKKEELDDPSEVEQFYLKTFEFMSGFMTEYKPSLITGNAAHQELAPGFPVGKRFRSAPVVRVCDANPIHLGHHARADGRWRIYVFADRSLPGTDSAVDRLARWLDTASDSPLARMPAGADRDAWFDIKVIYQQAFEAIDLGRVPAVFLPLVGQLQATDYQKVYCAGHAPDGTASDIFAEREVNRGGVMVVVRPDMYVAQVLPLTATDELAAFFTPVLDAGR